jgi:preprotein translocase subunit YajC
MVSGQTLFNCSTIYSSKMEGYTMGYRSSHVLMVIISVASMGLVYAEGGSGAPASPLGMLGNPMFMMMGVMIFALYFLMIRPEQKKQKERQAMLQAIKKGDRVMTSAGMVGTVHSIKENTIMVKIADNTVVEFTKSAVVSVINKDGSEKPAEPTNEKGE